MSVRQVLPGASLQAVVGEAVAGVSELVSHLWRESVTAERGRGVNLTRSRTPAETGGSPKKNGELGGSHR